MEEDEAETGHDIGEEMLLKEVIDNAYRTYNSIHAYIEKIDGNIFYLRGHENNGIGFDEEKKMVVVVDENVELRSGFRLLTLDDFSEGDWIYIFYDNIYEENGVWILGSATRVSQV